MPNDVASGSYFGGRKPEDGRIDWSRPAKAIHDLVRAVAPPYPGAFTTIDGTPVVVERTRLASSAPVGEPATLRVVDGRTIAVGGDGHALEIVAATIGDERLDAAALAARFAGAPHRLGDDA